MIAKPVGGAGAAEHTLEDAVSFTPRHPSMARVAALFALVCFIAALAPLGGQAVADLAAPGEADRQAVWEAEEGFAAAFAARDPERFAAFLAEDAVFAAPTPCCAARQRCARRGRE